MVGVACLAERDQRPCVNQNASGPDLHASILCAAAQCRAAMCRTCRSRYMRPSCPRVSWVCERRAASRAALRALARPDQMRPRCSPRKQTINGITQVRRCGMVSGQTSSLWQARITPRFLHSRSTNVRFNQTGQARLDPPAFPAAAK